MVITAGTEASQQSTEKRNKLTFLSSKVNDQSGLYNRKVMAEMEATIAGFTVDEIKTMTDVKTEGNAELMAECAMDIKRLLRGDIVEPNEMANTAYLQKFRNYMRDESDYFKKHPELAMRMWAYFDSLNDVVLRNMMQDVNKQLMQQGLTTIPGLANGMGGGEAPAPEMTPMVGGGQGQAMLNYGK